MKTRKLAILLLFSFLLMPSAEISANFNQIPTRIIYVTEAGTATNSCADWAHACDLQTALSLAASGDQIWVAAGLYKTIILVAGDPANKGREASFNLVSGVEIYGGFPAVGGTWSSRNWQTQRSILSGDVSPVLGHDSYHVVRAGSSIGETTVLDGLIITEGAASFEDHSFGGGLFNEGGSPTLSHVIFENNVAGSGGGMYNIGGSPKLNDVTFLNNRGSGGGIYNDHSNPNLTDVFFIDNQADEGGGMYNLASNPTLTRVTFTDNSAASGGGIYNASNSNPVLTDVTISGNTADEGGGIYNNQSSPVLTRVTFTDNSATLQGGGMLNNDQSNPRLTTVSFAINSSGSAGGGMFNAANSNPILSFVSFDGNSALDGGGMENSYSHPVLSDCLFHANEATEGAAMKNGNSDPDLTRVSFTSNIGCGMSNSQSSPSLTDIIFKANSQGGMYNSDYSSPDLRNVTFEGNFGSQYGAGMRNYNYCNPTLTNVTFSGNVAKDGGGGLYNFQESNPILTNVTFATNPASLFGGGILNHGNSDPSLTNVILWGNTPQQIYNWDASLSQPIIAFSDIQGCGGSSAWSSTCGIDAGNNLDEDPLLTGLNYYSSFTRILGLKAGSPAIDTGTSTGCPSTDQRNLTRPVDGDEDGTALCDIGAFEFDPISYLYLPLISR